MSEMPRGSKRYKKKPVIIKAIQLFELFEVWTKEGSRIGKAGDYLIEGIEGELSLCDRKIFEKTYEEVKNQ